MLTRVNKVFKVTINYKFFLRHSLMLHWFALYGWLGKYAPIKLNFPFCKEKPLFGALLTVYQTGVRSVRCTKRQFDPFALKISSLDEYTPA